MNVTKAEARGYLTEYVRSIATKSHGDMYVCPLCGSGTGKSKTGAFSIKDGTTWKCFSCDQGGDIFDLIGRHEGLVNYADQVKWLESWKGVTVSTGNETAPAAPAPRTTPANYSTYYLQAKQRLNETDYHRGISNETLARFNVGFDPAWTHPEPKDPTKKKYPSPRLIIPTSHESYIARDTRPDAPAEYAKMKVGHVHIFNARALERAERPIFVVEGELDALSIIDAGGEAIALGSTTMIKKLAEILEKNKPGQPLIIALDDDEAGKKAADNLAVELERLGIPFYRSNPAAGHKDANEALQADREKLAANIAAIYQELNKTDEEREAEARAEYERRSAANYIDDFQREIQASKDRTIYGTGYGKLDEILDGGLYEGLYIVGAISSLGKTTMVLQMADQIAAQGGDVLYFTLEMGRHRLMARSVSRLTAQHCIENGGDTRNAKTAHGVLDGRRYVGYTKPNGDQVQPYSDQERLIIKEAIKQYSEYADHIYIFEGHNDTTVDDVEKAIQEHIHFTGRVPVVFIDYLQILAPHDPKATDKQNTDYTMNNLARIVREYRLPIVAVSSFNRDAYKGKGGNEASMSSFKESGLIEYGADVLIGLQFVGTGSSGFSFDEAKKKKPREIEAIILKNRDGETGAKAYFKYYAMFNMFEEWDGAMGWDDTI